MRVMMPSKPINEFAAGQDIGVLCFGDSDHVAHAIDKGCADQCRRKAGQAITRTMCASRHRTGNRLRVNVALIRQRQTLRPQWIAKVADRGLG